MCVCVSAFYAAGSHVCVHNVFSGRHDNAVQCPTYSRITYKPVVIVSFDPIPMISVFLGFMILV